MINAQQITSDSSIPATDYSFAGQRQVEEGLAELEGQSVFESLAINDQCKFIFFSQRVAQGGTVGGERGTSGLQEDKCTEKKMQIIIFNITKILS